MYNKLTFAGACLAFNLGSITKSIILALNQEITNLVVLALMIISMGSKTYCVFSVFQKWLIIWKMWWNKHYMHLNLYKKRYDVFCVSLRKKCPNESRCGKIRTRKTSNTGIRKSCVDLTLYCNKGFLKGTVFET